MGRLLAQTCPVGRGDACPLRPGCSGVNLFRYRSRVVDLDPEVSDGAFDLRVARQELHGTQVSCAPVDQGCLCSSERMRSEQVRIQADTGNPLAKETSVLSGREASVGATSTNTYSPGFLPVAFTWSSPAGHVASVGSNPTGRPVFFRRTVVRSAAWLLGAMSSSLCATTSQPRSLLSITVARPISTRNHEATCGPASLRPR